MSDMIDEKEKLEESSELQETEAVNEAEVSEQEEEKTLTAADIYVHEEGEVHFESPMRFKDLFAFRLRYAYLGLNGVAFWILLILVGGCLIGYWDTYKMSTRILLLFVLFLLLVYQPANSALQTIQYTTQLKADNVVLEYFVNTSGILVVQGESSDLISWDVIRKVKETKKRFFISVMRNSAFVFGKDILLEQTERLQYYINTCYQAKK